MKKGGRNHSLFILNGMQINTTQHRPTPKSINQTLWAYAG